MNNFPQQEVELTEVTINQEVFDFMNINNDLVTENTDSTMNVESVILENKNISTKPPNKIKDTNNPPVLKAANLDKKSDLLTKNSNKIKTIVKPEVNTDETLKNFRALSLNEVIELWSELSKIPTPECKCRSKKKIKK